MKRATLVALVLATILFALPALSQTAKSMYCDLRVIPGLLPPATCRAITGSTAFTLSEVTIQASDWVRKTDTNCPSPGDWWEAHFKINLSPDPGFTLPKTAYIVAEYQDTPSSWTVDIGDSPGDNGFGGDFEKAAEVQVVDQKLSVFDDNTGVPGQVDNMLTQLESLTDGSLKFTITDQTLTIGPPWTRLWTPVTKLLYTLPDPLEDPAPDKCPGKSCIYAAFNAVISPTPGRVGCGVRSVTISIGNN